MFNPQVTHIHIYLCLLQSIAVLTLLLLADFVTKSQSHTIIHVKYPHSRLSEERAQPAKRDLSLSYAATNIDSKEGTRVKTITVIKNVGNINEPITNKKQQKLAINPELHKNEEWASAFRDNFDSYGVLPDVPDIDDLFEFVNRKKPSAAQPNENRLAKAATEKSAAAESTTKSTSLAAEAMQPAATVATAGNKQSAEAAVEKIKGDAELLPHTQEANILRLQSLAALENASKPKEPAEKKIRTHESLINVNYSTPMHTVMQYYDKYVQALPNGYDYSKPCAYTPPPNSFTVTTPSGRKYDIPRSNSSGTGGGNHPYLAPSLTKKTQVQPAQPQQPPNTPNYSSVNSLVPPLAQAGVNLPAPPSVATATPPSAAFVPQQPPSQQGTGVGISTSQRPYVAPSLRNNGLGINRGPPTPPQPTTPLPLYGGNGPSYRTNGFGGVPNHLNTFRSRGLKY